VRCAVAGMRCAWQVCGVRCGVAGMCCAFRAHQNVSLYVEYVLSMGLHIHGYVVCCQSTPARITCRTHAVHYSSTHHARTTILILTHARTRECACARLCLCIYNSMYLYTYVVHAHGKGQHTHTHTHTHKYTRTHTPQSPKHSAPHRAKSPNQRPGTGVGE
jgi:hypothetical protein